MVDTVRCESFQQITPEFLDKLLVGSLKRDIDQKDLTRTRTASSTTSPPLPASGPTTTPAASAVLSHSASTASNGTTSYPHSGPRTSGRTFSGSTLVDNSTAYYRQPNMLETLEEAQSSSTNGKAAYHGESGEPSSPSHQRKQTLPFRTSFASHDQPETGDLSRKSTGLGSFKHKSFIHRS